MPAEEVAEPRPQRRSAADDVVDLPADRGPQLAVDEAVEELVPQPQQQARAAAGRGTRCTPRAVDSAWREDPALALRRGLVLRRVVDLLEDVGHGEDDRRLELDEERGAFLASLLWARWTRLWTAVSWMDRARMCATGMKSSVLLRSLKTSSVTFVGGHDVVDLAQQVGVGDGAALGAPRRAGRVDDRGQRRRSSVTCGGPRPRTGRAATRRGERRRGRPGRRAATRPQVGRPVAHGRDHVGDGGVRDEHADRTGVAQDPLDLLGRRRLVDRHGDPAGGPDRVVAHHPLEARARHDRDAVARARGPRP